MTQTTSEGLPAPRREEICRKEAFLAGHSQCLNQHEKKLLPQWLKDIGGKEGRRGWMWFLPCSFQTFSLALQTFLLFLTPLSPFHRSFFSYFLQGFHSFFLFLLPSGPTHSLPFLISSLCSLPFFVYCLCLFFSALSLTFLFLPLAKGATSHLCHSTCLPSFGFLMDLSFPCCLLVCIFVLSVLLSLFIMSLCLPCTISGAFFFHHSEH